MSERDESHPSTLPNGRPPSNAQGPLRPQVTVAVLAVVCVALGAWAWSASRRAEAVGLEHQQAMAGAQRGLQEAKVEAALAAWHEGDGLRARSLLRGAENHPLARGLAWLLAERGVPEVTWKVSVPAGCAAVARVGPVIACASLNGVLLYGAEGSMVGELRTGPTGWQHVVVALNDAQLASAGDDRVLHVWDLAQAEPREMRRVGGFAAPIRALAFDGVELAAGLGDGAVVRVDPLDHVTVVTTHFRPVTRVAAWPGTTASVSEGLLRVSGPVPMELDRHVGALAALGAAELWAGVERSVVQLREGEGANVLNGHRDDVTALAWVHDASGGHMVSGGADGTVRWWNTDGTLDGLMSGFGPGVQALAVTADGQLVIATTRRTLEQWRLPKPLLAPDATGIPSALALWPSGEVITGYRDGHVRRVDSASGQRHELEARHRAPVRAVARVYGPEQSDALRFVSGGDDGRVLAQRWNGSVEMLDDFPRGRVQALATSYQGLLAAWATDDGTVVVWNLALGTEVSRQRDTLVRALAFSADGRALAVGREDHFILVLDAQTGSQKARLGPLDASVTALAFSPDGAFLAAGSNDGRVSWWNAATSQLVKTWAQPSGRVGSIDVRADGALVAAGSDDGRAYIFSVEHAEPFAIIPCDAGDVLLVGFTEQGLTVVGTDRRTHALVMTADLN
jgi:WD40 repeat protein